MSILDLNVRERSSLPVAEVLRGRSIPFLFLTGYGTARRYHGAKLQGEDAQ